MAGKVYLVGAGPGDPKLITVRGVECIREADVIAYDRLANPLLLEYARPDAELLYVGKLPDRHSLPQEEINALLVQKALDGKTVTRLKGGDPFVFGRGGEEAAELAEHGIAFEVVPGVTAGIAAAAYAGIPVTQRHVASSFAVVAGHECPGKEQSSIRWDKISTAVDTIAFYLGVKNLPLICEQLILHGRDPETPVAIIHWGTMPEQRTVVGTLTTIVEIAREQEIANPSIILVGEVVNVREKIRWFDAN
ncbi:uroporphyrinogen-III C-methyltransferase [Tumebacillus permanentifrigoris]|uniref:Uroporphyrinogen-III C-methyltransferase n=1 Tax=Tumebacillus permanentifrigoris TaxID=378543 RepID=A0A316DBZ9_9BACL|nr:uroporphyrinogen-III C-methyltransferase [Tumebacillus permanentifrigoris]PWK14817.1 uroporphyrin-III C-methyltransferase [Tumebacillus permanentifrigoris]